MSIDAKHYRELRDMNGSSHDSDGQEDGWPFEEVMDAGRQGAREQQRRFLTYVSENDPAMAAALAAEAVRFDIVSRAIIEPTMRKFAVEARREGWHVSVTRDDDLERQAMFATPGIRFQCSRQPSHDATSELLWPRCFVGFYGSARYLAVGTCVDLSGLNGEAIPSSEPLLEYPDVTAETVRAVLIAFLRDLAHLS